MPVPGVGTQTSLQGILTACAEEATGDAYCCTTPPSLHSLQGLLELLRGEAKQSFFIYCLCSKATVSLSLIFNWKAGSGHASVASQMHQRRTRRRHKVLGKGGGHHVPPPQVASATDKGAGGTQTCNPGRLHATTIQGSSPAECCPTKVYTQAQTWHRPDWLQWDTHEHIALSTTTDPCLRPPKPKLQLGRVTKMLGGIMSQQKLRIRILLLIN